MPITTKVVSSNPAHGEVYSIQLYVIKFISNLRHVGNFQQTGRHDITEIVLKVALTTLTLTLTTIDNRYNECNVFFLQAYGNVYLKKSW
jgi:hypothetical protein